MHCHLQDNFLFFHKQTTLFTVSESSSKRILFLVSVFLMKCLQKTKFYSATKTTSEDDYHIASVIHRMISACPANTHEMHVLATPTRDKWSPLAELQQLGAGLYPTAALFNHSCDPNIVRYNWIEFVIGKMWSSEYDFNLNT